ncbi:MAG: radical SAM protein, partial [Deltaproteobacteria bacterium]|nr:radical SAM protein [Deltaproteobacteria bacterium]
RRCLMDDHAFPLVPRSEIPPLSELAAAVAWLVARYGVDRVKVTGGEPLVRGGVAAFVEMVAAIPGVLEISMTTNGTRLAAAARDLAKAGLARVNVSLDTLDAARFRELTRGGRVEEALAGIDAALEAGLTPLKINSVLRRSSFREDVPTLLDFATEKGVEIRFIELMHTGTEAAWALAERVSGATVREWLEAEGADLAPLPSRPNAPARRTAIAWRGSEVVAGWIDPVSHSFCEDCDRLRLDARGRLRRCLMDDHAFPLVDLLRRGEAYVAEAAALYVAGKQPPIAMTIGSTMASIGG